MLQICKRDRVPFAVGLASCPECGHSEFWLQGEEPAVEEPTAAQKRGRGKPTESVPTVEAGASSQDS